MTGSAEAVVASVTDHPRPSKGYATALETSSVAGSSSRLTENVLEVEIRVAVQLCITTVRPGRRDDANHHSIDQSLGGYRTGGSLSPPAVNLGWTGVTHRIDKDEQGCRLRMNSVSAGPSAVERSRAATRLH